MHCICGYGSGREVKLMNMGMRYGRINKQIAQKAEVGRSVTYGCG